MIWSAVGRALRVGWALVGLKYDTQSRLPSRCPPIRSIADLSMPVKSSAFGPPEIFLMLLVSPDRLTPEKYRLSPNPLCLAMLAHRPDRHQLAGEHAAVVGGEVTEVGARVGAQRLVRGPGGWQDRLGVVEVAADPYAVAGGAGDLLAGDMDRFGVAEVGHVDRVVPADDGAVHDGRSNDDDHLCHLIPCVVHDHRQNDGDHPVELAVLVEVAGLPRHRLSGLAEQVDVAHRAAQVVVA